jgi:hypothetical protein
VVADVRVPNFDLPRAGVLLVHRVHSERSLVLSPITSAHQKVPVGIRSEPDDVQSSK